MTKEPARLGLDTTPGLDNRSGLDIWLVDLEAGERAMGRLDEEHHLVRPLATETETAKAWAGHARQRSARIALRAVLAGYVGLERARQPFMLGAAGKPKLGAVTAPGTSAPGRAGIGSIEFSLTHCEQAALIAVSHVGPVGVDIESVRPVRINPERRAMLEDAATLLSPDEPLPVALDDRRFLQAWVRLEALAKATGEGISALLGRLGIRGRSLLAASIETGVGETGMGQTGVCEPMLVRDLRLDIQPSLHAAIAGTLPLLGSGQPSPIVRALPLDEAFLDDLVLSRTLAWPRSPAAQSG